MHRQRENLPFCDMYFSRAGKAHVAEATGPVSMYFWLGRCFLNNP